MTPETALLLLLGVFALFVLRPEKRDASGRLDLESPAEPPSPRSGWAASHPARRPRSRQRHLDRLPRRHR